MRGVHSENFSFIEVVICQLIQHSRHGRFIDHRPIDDAPVGVFERWTLNFSNVCLLTPASVCFNHLRPTLPGEPYRTGLLHRTPEYHGTCRGRYSCIPGLIAAVTITSYTIKTFILKENAAHSTHSALLRERFAPQGEYFAPP